MFEVKYIKMKKLPLGIKIIGIEQLILGLYFALGFIGYFLHRDYVVALFVLPFSIVFLLLGKGILALNNTVRIWLIVVMKIFAVLISLLVLIFGLGIFQGNFFDVFPLVVLLLLIVYLIFILPIYYLNCPKINEQFKQP